MSTSAAAPMIAPRGVVEAEEEEIPLEIEDYSCNTFFEETVAEVERYILEEFRTQPALRPYLHSSNVDSASLPLAGNGERAVFGRTFRVGRHGEDGVAVEIHLHDAPHPVWRLFALPLFFLARGTAAAGTYGATESSYYLSLLTTAVGAASRGGRLSLRVGTDPSPLPSPFFYPTGTAPCLVAVGDHYQLVFTGVAPPTQGDGRGGQVEGSFRDCLAHSVFRTRFHCTAYPKPPEWCRCVGDYLDMFQLQVGPHSRVLTDVFDGICVSLQRTYRLRVPRRFPLSQTDARMDALGQPREATLTWRTILEIENETMLLSAGPTTFPFGTGTGPLQGIRFTFLWSKLHDTQVHEDGKRSSSLDPFASESVELQRMCSIHAEAIPKKECELSHTASETVSEYAYMVMEYLSTHDESLHGRGKHVELPNLADEIVNSHVLSLPGQRALLDRLVEHYNGSKLTGADVDIRYVYFPSSLLCRFSYICATRLEVAQDVQALWVSVVQRLKELLEGRGERRHSLQLLIESIGMPAVDEIDHSLPLILQKLQLLSYCARRMLYERGDHVTPGYGVNGWEDDSEFAISQNMGGSHSTCTAANQTLLGAKSDKAVESTEKRLITNGEPLMEPQAVPQPPCTTDMLLQKAEVLQNLGTAAVSQSTRAWAQSDGLLNDMCAFLYANEAHKGRVVRFPDFVQWHSPRDFIHPQAGRQKSTRAKSSSFGKSDKSTSVGAPVADLNNTTNNMDDNEYEDEDAYLSERMRRHSRDGSANVWWTLWAQATPRSPEEILAHSFVAHEQARLILLWMERDLATHALLLETIHANLSNGLHRMLSHRCFGNNPAMATYALERSAHIANSIKTVAPLLSIVGADAAFMDVENLRTTYATSIRQIGEIETCLCAALSLERLLGRALTPNSTPTPDVTLSTVEGDNTAEARGVPKRCLCNTLVELVAVLASPTESQEDAGGLTLRRAELSWGVWRRGGLVQLFTGNEQQTVEMRMRATCMAERPLNTAACFQQMMVETDEAGVFRVALALGEEVM